MTAIGTGPLTYKWFRNGVELPGGTTFADSGAAVTYTIDTVALADNGNQYAVQVSNSVGSVSSVTVTLFVGP